MRNHDWRALWRIRGDTTYLNHGSFGPPPRAVRAAQLAWQERMHEQPMDFFVRQFEPAWLAARARLAQWVGCAADDLIFVENATAGMNLIAASFALRPGDEVLLNDHEYGAVKRIWQRACQRAGAAEPRVTRLPDVIESVPQVVEAIFAAATPRTRVLVVSHITSPTAITLPVEAICREARRRGIATVIDGPHAIAQLPVDISQLACDFYTASGHKWLCAPLGSGFLYVAPAFQSRVAPLFQSWGRIPPAEPSAWWEEFVWSGTRDASAFLTMPAAIDFMAGIGWDLVREATHDVARYARAELAALTGCEPIVPDSPDWYGMMACVPLPPVDAAGLQRRLWECHGIEVPIIDFAGRQFVRVSCPLYVGPEEVARLLSALRTELPIART